MCLGLKRYENRIPRLVIEQYTIIHPLNLPTMNLVLITHKGLVTIVPVAPAVIAARMCTVHSLPDDSVNEKNGGEEGDEEMKSERGLGVSESSSSGRVVWVLDAWIGHSWILISNECPSLATRPTPGIVPYT